MTPDTIKDYTHVLGAPKDWDAETYGECRPLYVRSRFGLSESAWRPSPEELAVLNAGGVIVLSVVGGQPAVFLEAQPADKALDLVGG